MIKIRIKNADHEIDVRFPISENELYAKLAEIHAIEEKDAPQSAFVTEVYWPEEFSMLKDRFANLDELNYLAKRMESFDYHEYDLWYEQREEVIRTYTEELPERIPLVDNSEFKSIKNVVIQEALNTC